MKRFFSGLVLWAALIGTAGTSMYFQNMGMNRVLQYAPFFDTWQLGGRSGQLMKVFSLRYDMVMADFLWLRSIQSFGGRGMSNRDWRPIYNQFDTITDLDPYFADAYNFGNLVIGDEGGYKHQGLDILHKGTNKVYSQYRVPFEAMYVGQWQLQDEEIARWYGLVSSQRLDAPEWVARMVAYIDVTAGEYYIGIDRFIGNLLSGMDANEPAFQEIALRKAAEAIDKWNASILAEAADQYMEQTGKTPGTIAELLRMPALQNYETASMSRLLASVARVTDHLSKRPIDPSLTAPYVAPDPELLAEPFTQALEGERESLVDYQDVVFNDTLTTRSGLPQNPQGQQYAINLMRIGNDQYADDEIFVPMNQLQMDAQEFLGDLREIIDARKLELGRNPTSLNEVFYTDFNTTEPFGGTWLYNPENGEVRMSTHPNF